MQNNLYNDGLVILQGHLGLEGRLVMQGIDKLGQEAGHLRQGNALETL